MEIGGRFGRLYVWLDWPVRLIGLNLLWILGVLAGLVVGGLAPSTYALYALQRSYLLGRSPRMWRDFWSQWRTHLLSAQAALGVPLLTVWVLVFYLLAARGTPVAPGLAVLLFLYLATLLQLPAVLVHLDLGTVQVWRVTVVLAWKRPGVTLVAALLVAVLVAGAWYATPAALPFLVPALPALLGTLAARRTLPE
ncbi:DUF624 domain-containing protein [Nonomuraea fuscirosea]|uniref:YesL family protein n=1 Tax=Nonomuraea fuscirosea TaxID=1291556 RepID=UPI002DD8FDD7|nr:DUF624 domain-containing protein [Nonomuraea fuscirosea]WSA49991.1 DUF624 domain-containing protein [Nonomuraea fuscirosea]